MVIECPAMEQYRRGCDLGTFKDLYRSMGHQFSSAKIYALYLSDKNDSVVKSRALSLSHMKLGWHKLMNIEI